MNPLLICNEREANSIMFNKMWNRTGRSVPVHINPLQKVPAESDFLIILGEENLKLYKPGEYDLFRWMGRKTSVSVQGRQIPAMFMQSPSLLLPKRSTDDE